MEIHNGQQPITHRNLGNYLEKPQCGKTQQDREILLFCLTKVQNNINNIFQLREIPLTTKNCPTQICLENRATIHTTVRICWKLAPWNSCHYRQLYLLFCTTVLLQKILQVLPRKPCTSLPWFSCLKNVVLRIRIVQHVPTNNTAAN